MALPAIRTLSGHLSQVIPQGWGKLALLALVVAAVLLPASPVYREIPMRDPGVFLYGGEQVLHGNALYRDVWDHKPPAIFYVNAAGLLIGNGSAWGVWMLEFVALFASAVIAFVLIKRTLGAVPAIFATLVYLAQMGVLLAFEGGNLTEEFALPLQFAALYLLSESEKRSPGAWRGFALGLTLAGAFLLKQNLVGLWVAILLYLLTSRILARNWRDLVARSLTIGAGCASVVLGVVLFFIAQGALDEFLDAAFKYNFAYASTTAGLRPRLAAVLVGFLLLCTSGIALVALLGWLRGVRTLISRGTKITQQNPLLLVAVIDLPLELLCTLISGRSYPHYYIPWLPVLTVLSAYFLYGWRKESGQPVAGASQSRGKAPFPLLPAVVLVMALVPVALILSQLLIGNGRFYQLVVADSWRSTRYEMVTYITRNTAPDEFVLFWGAEAGLNFVAQRRSPTRFAYQYPLYTGRYQSGEMVEEFLGEVQANPPILIVDASSGTDKVPPIDDAARQQWVSPWESYQPLPEMQAVFDYIDTHYELVDSVGSEQWAVYRLVDR